MTARVVPVLMAAALVAGCLSEESGPLRTPIEDASGRLHPATVACTTVAATPATITPGSVAGTPRADRLAEKLALFASGALVAPQPMYDRVAADLARIRAAHPAYAGIEHGGCYRPDRLFLLFDDAAFAQVQSGTYDAWDELNALLRGAPAGAATVANSVWLEFDGMYNMNRVVGEYQRLPGVRSGGTDHWVGLSTRACMAERSFYNLYILGLGSGDCLAGCTRWRYLGVAVDDNGNVIPLGEYDTATMAMPRWFERAADCRAVLISPHVG